MEFHELKALLSKNENVKKFFDETRGGKVITDYDSFEKEINQKIFGSSEVDPHKDITRWLANFLLRYSRGMYDEAYLSRLSELIAEPVFTNSLNKAFSAEGESVDKLVKSLANGALVNHKIKLRKVKAKGKDQKWNSGDIFRFPVEDGTGVFGRIILPIKNCLKKKKQDPRTNRLVSFAEYYLVELYKNDSLPKKSEDVELLFSGLIFTDGAFSDGYCEKVGNKSVEQKEIDFPEYLTNEINEKGAEQNYFVKGELMIPVEISSSLKWQFLFRDDVEFNSYTMDFFVNGQFTREDLNFDIRYNSVEIRKEIYNLIGESPEPSYLQLATKRGIDVSNYLK